MPPPPTLLELSSSLIPINNARLERAPPPHNATKDKIKIKQK